MSLAIKVLVEGSTDAMVLSRIYDQNQFSFQKAADPNKMLAEAKTILKSETYSVVGIVKDADTSQANVLNGYRSDLELKEIKTLVDDANSNSAFFHSPSGKTLGIFIASVGGRGMIETCILKTLLDQTGRDYAAEYVKRAPKSVRTCSEDHLDKAELFAFLALKRKPDDRPWMALAKNLVDRSKAPWPELQNWLETLSRLSQELK